jgi:hypothetical protein
MSGRLWSAVLVLGLGIAPGTQSVVACSPVDWQQDVCWPYFWIQAPIDARVPVRSATKVARPAQRLAQPTLAPPSPEKKTAAPEPKQTPTAPIKPAIVESSKVERPQEQHGAGVREEGPFYDSFPIVLKAKPANDQCTVTFQNLTGHAIKVIVNNREQSLAHKETATLAVLRQFVWRVEGREPQNEQMSKNDNALQIVIRR